MSIRALGFGEISVTLLASVVIGCGSGVSKLDGGDTGTPDDGGDATGDSPVDVPIDSGVDTGIDTMADGVVDMMVDTGSDLDAATDPDLVVPAPPSCAGMDGDECGGDDCCAYVNVPGGWFAMGRGTGAACASTPVAGAGCTASTVTCLSGGVTWGCPEGTWLSLGGDDAEDAGGADELPEHVVWIDGFSMDVYEVTVGRMRRFVEEYDKAALVSSLSAGAGEHPLIAGSEWSSSWDSRLPADAETLSEALQCDPSSQTWTDAASGNETFPINCVSWYLAYAFCAWDGGRIPTAAEWERTAAGGDENRLYPWGESDPDATLANYLMTDNSTFVDVHAKPLGAGRWGHQGLAGSVWEWVLDLHDEGWYAGGGNDCVNCANVAGEGARIMKGGDWQYHAVNLRAADLFAGSAASDWLGSGLRCVR